MNPGRQLPCRTAARNLAAARLGKVRAYVEANLANTIRTAALAQLVALSTTHFSRAFKQIAGVTPQRYVRLRRLEAAQVMMRTTTEKLSAIAVSCGLSDQAHLTRIFRQWVGLSPARWRDREQRAAEPD